MYSTPFNPYNNLSIFAYQQQLHLLNIESVLMSMSWYSVPGLGKGFPLLVQLSKVNMFERRLVKSQMLSDHDVWLLDSCVERMIMRTSCTESCGSTPGYAVHTSYFQLLNVLRTCPNMTTRIRVCCLMTHVTLQPLPLLA